LTRVVARKTETGPASELVFDLNAQMPGRGAWLHPSSECLRLAIERRAFTRALRLNGTPNVAGLNFSKEQAEIMLATNE